MKGAFALTTLAGPEAKTHSEELHAMKNIYKIDERAVKDFDFLEGLTKDTRTAPGSPLCQYEWDTLPLFN